MALMLRITRKALTIQFDEETADALVKCLKNMVTEEDAPKERFQPSTLGCALECFSPCCKQHIQSVPDSRHSHGYTASLAHVPCVLAEYVQRIILCFFQNCIWRKRRGTSEYGFHSNTHLQCGILSE